MVLGSTNGSVDSEQLRAALVEAEVEPKRMKAVLRSLEEQGIGITLDTAHATRAVAATSTTPTHRVGVRRRRPRSRRPP